MSWSSGIFDVTAEPGGIKLFAYTCCCSCFAAGDVAVEAEGNFVASCFLPYFVPLLGLCLRCDSRKKLVQKYAIAEEASPLPVEMVKVCCLNPCLLRQELSHIAKQKNISSDKLFIPENEVVFRKPSPDNAGKAVSYTVTAVGNVLNGAKSGVGK